MIVVCSEAVMPRLFMASSAIFAVYKVANVFAVRYCTIAMKYNMVF
jgi:hypothetical protein